MNDYPNPGSCGFWAAALKFPRKPPDGDGQTKHAWRDKWFDGYDSYEKRKDKRLGG